MQFDKVALQGLPSPNSSQVRCNVLSHEGVANKWRVSTLRLLRAIFVRYRCALFLHTRGATTRVVAVGPTSTYRSEDQCDKMLSAWWKLDG